MTVEVKTEEGSVFLEVVQGLDPSTGVAPWTWEEYFANQWVCIPER